MTEDILERLMKAVPILRGPASPLVRDSITEIEDLRGQIEALEEELLEAQGQSALVPVLLPSWVVNALTNSGETMYDGKVQRIWKLVVRACQKSVDNSGDAICD